MNREQQLRCVALLLAISFDGDTPKEQIQKAIKLQLAALPPDLVARAAAVPIQF